MLKKLIFSLIFILSFLSLLGFRYFSEKQNKTIVIDLTHKSFDKEFFIDQDYYYTTLKLQRFETAPKFENYLTKNYKGIPENDSVSFYGCFMDGTFMFDLNKSGDLSDENMKGIIEGEDVDTLNYSKVKLKSTLITVVGFFKDKQFMIADVNRNKDFNDDVKYEYDIKFRANPYKSYKFLNDLPVTEYTYEDCYKGNIQEYHRRFIIYPDKNNPFSLSAKINPKKEREYFSILKLRDYWKGEAVINNKKMQLYYHGYNNKYGSLYVKPKDVPYKRNSANFENQYMHKYYANDIYDDTITIVDKRYKIDSINRTISKLYLREVGKRNHYGCQVDDYINNFQFDDLQNKTFYTNDIIGKKKYTLIEFWGTWCGPCIKLTPKLKETYKKYFSMLNMVSIAVDKDRETVQKYIYKNNIDWRIGYISQNRNWENSIIKQLKIKYFPTFILLDSKGKILTIASSDSFDDLLKKLK